MICSPFRFDSYEPRFVIEHYAPGLLAHAIALWSACDFRSGPVTHAARSPTALLLTRADHPGPWHPWEKLPAPLAVDEIAPFIARWLKAATVEEPQPNFDGDEVKGYCAFWGYFRGEEVEHGYGCFIVQTKWFEIHK